MYQESSLREHIAKRLLQASVIILAIIVFNFMIMLMGPGDSINNPRRRIKKGYVRATREHSSSRACGC